MAPSQMLAAFGVKAIGMLPPSLLVRSQYPDALWCDWQGMRNGMTLINHLTGGSFKGVGSFHSLIPYLSHQQLLP